MAEAAAPLQIAMGVVQAVGQIASGAGKASAYQSNARAALQQAEVARQQSYIKAGYVERQAAESMGQAQALQGKGGVSPNMWLLADSVHRAAMAKQLEIYKGTSEASAQQREADIQHAQATQARTGSYVGAATSLLGSLASAAGAGFMGGPVSSTSAGVSGKLDMGKGFGTAAITGNPMTLDYTPSFWDRVGF